ncbi:MAG: type II secretion system major pseudopilin GspG [Bdellovibrionia bacterium]
MLNPTTSLQNKRGMTLLEIMIVLVIVGGLVAILAQNVMGKLGKAQVSEAKIQMKELGKQLDLFYTDCGFYPSSLEGLVQADSNCKNWGPEPYIKRVPKDPWNTEYGYSVEGSSYQLKSLGRGGKEGGTGSDADITSDDI